MKEEADRIMMPAAPIVIKKRQRMQMDEDDENTLDAKTPRLENIFNKLAENAS